MEDARSACTGLCFLYNHREDRPDRALLFARHFFPFYKNHTVYLTGSGAALPKRLFARAGVTDLRVARDYRECLKQIPSGALLVGIGNIKGAGYRMIKELEEHNPEMAGTVTERGMER